MNRFCWKYGVYVLDYQQDENTKKIDKKRKKWIQIVFWCGRVWGFGIAYVGRGDSLMEWWVGFIEMHSRSVLPLEIGTLEGCPDSGIWWKVFPLVITRWKGTHEGFPDAGIWWEFFLWLLRARRAPTRDAPTQEFGGRFSFVLCH